MKRLQDRIAVITGAGRSIGREIALLMASQGAKGYGERFGATQMAPAPPIATRWSKKSKLLAVKRYPTRTLLPTWLAASA